MTTPATSTRTAPAIVPLTAVGRNDIPLVGGKGANLGELTAAGFPVPPGFVVTTDAYRTVLEEGGLSERLPELLSDDGEALRGAITAHPLPDALARSITEAYRALGGPVAVRSSATAEDLPGAAFAGQQDTYLGIIGADAVLDAVRACWASLWTERAIAYRHRLGIEPADVAIAVVVQSLVPADAAGVMFTADPVTGIRDHFVIDASPGLGESVVSGIVTPDHYVLDRDGRRLEWSAGNREVVISSDAAGGTVESRGETSTEPLLQPETLTQLAGLGTGIAEHFGSPQDIEWAIAGGELRIVQARPITALPIPQRLNRVQRFIGSVFSDYFSVRPYPLDMTTWVPFGPLGLMDCVVASVGIRSHFDRILPEEDGVVVQFIPPRPRPTWRVLGAPFSVASRVRRHDPARWREDPRYLEFEGMLHGLAGRDLDALSWHELVDEAQAALRLIDPITALRVSYLPAMGVGIVRLRLALALLRRGRLIGDLVVGAHTVTAEGNERLADLAGLVRDDPSLMALFTAGDAAGTLDALCTDPGHAAFAAEFDAYLARFGHRETTSPVLVSSPTWGDAPELVVGLIAVLAAEHEPRPASTRAADAERDLFAHRRLRSARARNRMRRRIDAARAGIAFREDSHDAFTRVVPVLRHTLLELGSRLNRAGLVADPFDVFHLRLEELKAIEDPEGLSSAESERLADLVRARMLKREQLSAVRMVDYAAIFARAEREPDAFVTGTPACAGRATGAVRVIRGPEDFGTLGPGEILVCPYTNPSWTPLFQRAAAVVVDTGGIGSHAAIVARELGIPAIMGTGDGTRVLTTGQTVTVDGTTGTVAAA